MLKFKTTNRLFFVVFLLLTLAVVVFKISFVYFFIHGIFWLIITYLGSFNMDWHYFLKSLISNPEIKENQIAITFDDGPNPEFTLQILALLAKYNAKATFFCIGKQIETHPEIFKNIINENHAVGNHTYSHDHFFGFFSTKKVTSELKKTNAIAKSISGFQMVLYRPAFGVTNPRIKKAVKHLNLQSIGWNKRSYDTTFLSEKVILSRITKNLKKGDVILLHDTNAKTVAVLEQLLLFLQQQNLESVTVDTLFNIKAYA